MQSNDVDVRRSRSRLTDTINRRRGGGGASHLLNFIYLFLFFFMKRHAGETTR